MRQTVVQIKGCTRFPQTRLFIQFKQGPHYIFDLLASVVKHTRECFEANWCRANGSSPALAVWQHMYTSCLPRYLQGASSKECNFAAVSAWWRWYKGPDVWVHEWGVRVEAVAMTLFLLLTGMREHIGKCCLKKTTNTKLEYFTNK